MQRLSAHDVPGLLEFLRLSYAVRDLGRFCDEVVPRLPDLIRSDLTGYRQMVPPHAISRGRFWPSEDRYDPHRFQDVFARHMREHPVLIQHRRTGDGHALKISDFMTQREFHHLGLYQEIYRSIGIEDVLAIVLPVPVPGGIGVSFHRHSPRFSERDRLMANLLRPHLTQAYLNAKAMSEFQSVLRSGERALEALTRGLIVLTPRHRIAFSTSNARDWLIKYFDHTRRPDLLPDNLLRWIAAECANLDSVTDVPYARVPLLVDREACRLAVRLLSDSRDLLLLFEEQRLVPPSASLAKLGLTTRETEVLTWLAEGKTNTEIGTIIGARPRTVAKHLEKIYQKLGVETRTAAARVALTASDATN